MDIENVSRVVVAILLLLAGVSKMSQRRSFAAALVALHVLPAPIVPWAATVIPVLEVTLAAILLLTNAAAPLLIAALLFVLFAMALAIALIKGSTASCACFGGRQQLDWTAPARTLCFAALAYGGMRESVVPVGISVLLYGLVAVVSKAHRKSMSAVHTSGLRM